MYSGTLIIHILPLGEKKRSISYIELVDSNIENFKNKVAEIFKSNDWNVATTRFQKSGSGKLFTYDQMENGEFIFTTVNVFLNVNI